MPGVDLISPDYIVHARQQFIAENELQSFVDYCTRPLRKSIRVNTLKISVEELINRFNHYGLSLKSIPWCSQGFWVEHDAAPKHATSDIHANLEQEISLGNMLEHLQGLFYIQEASSMLPPIALLQRPLPDKSVTILDLAAAPGSKTTQLAALINNNGLILANEKSASRVKILHSNLVRCGISNTCISQFDGNKLKDRLSNYFDYVLLDAPCGGEGTLRKDLTALKNWSLEKVLEIAELQKQLILTAYNCLKPGGQLVYSTCTLSKEENHQVAQFLLDSTDAKVEMLDQLFTGADKSVTAEGFLHVLPQIYDSEGFFVAAFTKPVNANARLAEVQQDSPFYKPEKNIQQRIERYYLEHFGLDFSISNKYIVQREKELWLFPKGYENLSSKVRLNRSGIKLADIYPNKIRSSHEFAISYGSRCPFKKVDLSVSETEEYLMGRNLFIGQQDLLSDGEVILMANGFPIGLGSLQKEKIKNLLPRSRVVDNIKLNI
ncbi:MAG: NOL1/NOP2/sun family putative RNA methylase [Kangiellaceae bacterium]|nr:NOL1/NOP2/sun family putative RNA methylase [Kangiellaceae bacterium]